MPPASSSTALNGGGAPLAWAGHDILVASPFALACDLVTLAGLFVALFRSERGRAAAA